MIKPSVLFMGNPLRNAIGIDCCENNNIPYMSIDKTDVGIIKPKDIIQTPPEHISASKIVNFNDLNKKTEFIPFESYFSVNYLIDLFVSKKFIPTLIINANDVKEDLELEVKLMSTYKTSSRFCRESLDFFTFKWSQKNIYDELDIPRIPDSGENGYCVKAGRRRVLKKHNIDALSDNAEIFCPKFRFEHSNYLPKSKYRYEFVQKWMDIEYCIGVFIFIDSKGKWDIQLITKDQTTNGGWRTYSVCPYKLTSSEDSQISTIISKLSKRLVVRSRLIYFELIKCFDDDIIYPQDFNCRTQGSSYQWGRYYNFFEDLITDKRKEVIYDNLPRFYMNNTNWNDNAELIDKINLKQIKPVNNPWFITKTEFM